MKYKREQLKEILISLLKVLIDDRLNIHIKEYRRSVLQDLLEDLLKDV